VRLKFEMHAIIGVCAAAAFVVIGVIAWLEVRHVHQVEVTAQGETMGLFLAKACALAMRGPSPLEDLERLLAVSGGDQEPPVVSAAVYDARQGKVVRVGSTVPEAEPSELRAALERAPDRVLVELGDEIERYGARRRTRCSGPRSRSCSARP
jgi:uncharacterized membrane protein affecting hemolysin expression